jgi:hypothetical protein
MGQEGRELKKKKEKERVKAAQCGKGNRQREMVASKGEGGRRWGGEGEQGGKRYQTASFGSMGTTTNTTGRSTPASSIARRDSASNAATSEKWFRCWKVTRERGTNADKGVRE